MNAQFACFGPKFGVKGRFLAKNGGLEALMAHSWARLPGLTSQAPGGWLEIESSVIITLALVGWGSRRNDVIVPEPLGILARRDTGQGSARFQQRSKSNSSRPPARGFSTPFLRLNASRRRRQS
mgnify:CR=1 FL=1